MAQEPHSIKLEYLQNKWKIKGFHFRDLELNNICKDNAMVLSPQNKAVMVKFYHVIKHRDNLFIIHNHVDYLYIASNRNMTISHLKTGKNIVHFKMKETESIMEMEQRLIKEVEGWVSQFSEKYAMEKIKSQVPINVKYNVYGH